mgnify:CR=1 FL=1
MKRRAFLLGGAAALSAPMLPASGRLAAPLEVFPPDAAIARHMELMRYVQDEASRLTGIARAEIGFYEGPKWPDRT